MKRRMGIRWKTAVFTIAVLCILTVTIGGIGYRQFHKNVLASYVKYAEMVVASANQVFEDHRMGDRIVERQMGEGYEAVREELNKIKNNADIQYLYAIYFADPDDLHSVCYVINAKNKAELSTGEAIEDIYSYMGEACEEDAFEESTLLLFQECLRSRDTEIRYQESETTEYGHLVTCYRAVLDSRGEAVAVVGADIDVSRIHRDLRAYLHTVFLAAALLTVVFILLLIRFLDLYITHPIEKITESADAFVGLMNRNVEPEALLYQKAEVRSRDELYMLAEDIESMADSVKKYMGNLRSVTAEKERIGAELHVATQIQADMLPRIFPAFPEREEFDIYATMKPAKEVGGDFYDFFLIDDDHLALVMADVSGKGVPAALFMVIAKTLIKNRAQMGKTPAEILSDVNTQLCEGNEAELFVTVWLAIIEISTGNGTAANAGHEHPILRRSREDYTLVKYRHSPAVAAMEGIRFKEHAFHLDRGDSLFVYTDGVPEANNIHHDLFGEERLLEALNREPDAAPEKVLRNVSEGILHFTDGAEQFDDITMLCLKYMGPAGKGEHP